MDEVPRRSRVRLVPRLVVPLALMAALLLGAPMGLVLAQIDPQVRDRVVPAIVEIAINIDANENGSTEARYLSVGSGTIVSPDGLILTNWHVVDMAALREELNAWEAHASEDGESLAFVLHEDRVLVLGTDGASAPKPAYTAEVVSEDHALDLAVLRITGDEFGAALPGTSTLPFVPLGDSSTVRQGDPLDLFGYPTIGGESLTYTDGVVSGFLYEEGIDGPAWITTNAAMSGGSSGGAALDRTGQLIGVPTQGSELDCRPGDTNQDGTIDAEDVGCIPLGGSIGQLRPINLAKPLLIDAGWTTPGEVEAVVPEPVATESATVAAEVVPTSTPESSVNQAVPPDDLLPTRVGAAAPPDMVVDDYTTTNSSVLDADHHGHRGRVQRRAPGERAAPRLLRRERELSIASTFPPRSLTVPASSFVTRVGPRTSPMTRTPLKKAGPGLSASSTTTR